MLHDKFTNLLKPKWGLGMLQGSSRRSGRVDLP